MKALTDKIITITVTA